jgi:hypothetical protein
VVNQPVTLVGFHADCAPSYNRDFAFGEEQQMIGFSTNGSSTGEISITYSPEYVGHWTVTARCRNYSELVARFVVTETAPPPTDPPSPPPSAGAVDTSDLTAPTTVPESAPAIADGVRPLYVG